MTRKSIEQYVNSKITYKCGKCGGKVAKDGEICSKCKYKKCAINDCEKYILKTSKYDICFDCSKEVREYLKNN